MDITFSFDPNCPWTWLTSRWLVKAAAAEGHDIEWGSLSLAHLNRDKEIPEKHRASVAAGTSAHRLIQALLAKGEVEAVGGFYDAYGTRVHRRGEQPGVAAVEAAATDAGLDPLFLDALADSALDAAAGTQTDAAVASAGGDVGSPVIRLGDGRAFFGPIVDEVPDTEASVVLLRALIALDGVGQFAELKRGRREPQVESS